MTECNVEEESQVGDSIDDSPYNEGSCKIKKTLKKQINNSFYLNNVSSSMDVRPASGLDSIKNADGKIVELKIDNLDNVTIKN